MQNINWKTLCQEMPGDPSRLKRMEILKEQLREILRNREASK